MLRTRLAGSAVALLLALAPAVAQQPAPAPAAPAAPAALPPTSHLQVARDVLNLSGVSTPIVGIFNEFATNIKQNLVTRPETHKDLDAVLGTLKPEVDKRVEEMIAVSSLVFARRMSEADLKEVKIFFESPVGRRYTDSRALMINEVYAQLQPWVIKTSDFMFNFVREGMKKRGHEIGG